MEYRTEVFRTEMENLAGIIILTVNWDWTLMKADCLNSLNFLAELTGISDRIFMGYRLLKQVQMNCLR